MNKLRNFLKIKNGDLQHEGVAFLPGALNQSLY
jgi:hypothetical protein